MATASVGMVDSKTEGKSWKALKKSFTFKLLTQQFPGRTLTENYINKKPKKPDNKNANQKQPTECIVVSPATEVKVEEKFAKLATFAAGLGSTSLEAGLESREVRIGSEHADPDAVKSSTRLEPSVKFDGSVTNKPAESTLGVRGGLIKHCQKRSGKGTSERGSFGGGSDVQNRSRFRREWDKRGQGSGVILSIWYYDLGLE